MKSITVDSSTDNFIITIDKKAINKDLLLKFIENLRLELLAKRVDFDESIEEFGKEMKQNWWQNNKDRFIPKEEQ